jgi:hypothetical protein
MGEAKRRKLSGDYPTITQSVPDDLTHEIAKVMHTVTLTQAGGSCVPYTQLGAEVLKRLGFVPRVELGSVLYRAGPDTRRDTQSYAGPNNMGCIVPDYGFVGHAWLRLGADLVDFSDWVRMAEVGYIALVEMADAGHDIAQAELALGRVQFDVIPPDYLWQLAAPLQAAWRPISSPEIGEFWYGPFDRRNGAPPIDVQDDWVAWMLPATMAAARELRLLERLTEWRNQL